MRGFELSDISESVTLHPFGWIEANNKTALQSELISLAKLINQTDLVMENHADKYFRLSLNPAMVFFDSCLFSFIVKQNSLASTQTKIPVSIQRAPFDTAIGKVKEKTEDFKLTLESVNNFKSLYEKATVTDNDDAVNIEGAYKKGLHKKSDFLALGLQHLIHRDAGIFKFTIKYKVIALKK